MLAAILNSLGEAVITVDRDHRISHFNRAAERLVGLPAGEALGRDCREVLRASSAPRSTTARWGAPRAGSRGPTWRGHWCAPTAGSSPFRRAGHSSKAGQGRSTGSSSLSAAFEEIERIAEERKSKFPFRDIVGKTLRIRRIFDLVEVVKDTDSTVLITGESGTGKGLFARAIHGLSPRREKPFVKVNAAALTETLLESELFGHVKGAFTGAVADKVGRFEAADGGTIFLDEIGEISPALQVSCFASSRTTSSSASGAAGPSGRTSG